MDDGIRAKGRRLCGAVRLSITNHHYAQNVAFAVIVGQSTLIQRPFEGDWIAIATGHKILETLALHDARSWPTDQKLALVPPIATARCEC